MKQILVLLFCLSVFAFNCVHSQEISDQCLGCICQASSGCNKNQGCTEAGVCGPFLITWPFWADAGKYVLTGTSPDDKDAYSKCTNDLYCASESVRAYTRKYTKDCNNDGVIDCEDFARIHRLGPGSCGDSSILETKYYKQFAQCKAQIRP